MEKRLERGSPPCEVGGSIAGPLRRVRQSAAMMPLKTDPRRRWLRSLGVLVIALLALGSAGHFWHHLTDDSCESPRQGFPHPCSQCAGFHGGVLAEATQAAAAPRLADLTPVFVGEDIDRVPQPRGVGAPRAPPLT